jgi:3-dehydroquinate synthase
VETVRVALAERSYNIFVGGGIIAQLGEFCRGAGLNGVAAVITNPLVASLYLAPVKDSLEGAGYRVVIVTIPDGEEYKNSDSLHHIYDGLILSGLDRGSFIVALGGGVIGDLAGFAAATFLRGIPFVQVPTTLLAQVDSSVGGKTGINHRLGKNLIGAFYQPAVVVADLDTLDTLPEREFLCGVAESLKYGVVLDRDLFAYLAESVESVQLRDKLTLQHIVAAACRIKAAVVASDERESGLRAVLNFGHTIGHAVETLSGYGTVKHGEAVAIGMAQAARLSCRRGLSTASELEQVITLIQSFGLATELPAFSVDEFEAIISHDKKMSGDGINFILNRGIGAFVIEKVTDLRSLLLTSKAAA